MAGGQRASRPSSRNRAWRLGAGLAATLAIAGGAVIGLAGPASAHNYMIASTPKVDGTLTSLPERFEITTNDKLLDIGGTGSGFAFQVIGPDGRYYENGCVTVDGPSMTTKAALGASGKYTVRWQIVSADGHTVSDDYGFTWDAPAGFTPSTGAAKAPVCAGSSSGSGSTGAGSADGGDTSSSVASDAIWIGAGGVVVIAAVVAVLLLLRRPRPDAGAPDDQDPDARA